MYIIRTLRIANWLVQNGFSIVTTMQDRDNPNFSVFLFERSDALLKKLNEYHTRDRSLDVKS